MRNFFRQVVWDFFLSEFLKNFSSGFMRFFSVKKKFVRKIFCQVLWDSFFVRIDEKNFLSGFMRFFFVRICEKKISSGFMRFFFVRIYEKFFLSGFMRFFLVRIFEKIFLSGFMRQIPWNYRNVLNPKCKKLVLLYLDSRIKWRHDRKT